MGRVAVRVLLAVMVTAVLVEASAAPQGDLAGFPAATGLSGSAESPATTAPPSAAPSPTASPAPATERPAASASPEAGAGPSSSPSPGASRSSLSSPRPAGAIDVPILYYHRVIEIPADIRTWSEARQNEFLAYMETPCELAVQVDWLDAHGYTTILPRDLANHWDHGWPLPSKPVVLTFDDGYPEWSDVVLPMLLARRFRAEFYVTVNRLDAGFSWDDVHALADAGMGIGAHDMDHIQLVGGGTIASLGEMRYQVGRAKEVLEAQLGVTVDSMAYVGGGFNETLERVAAEAGYRTARSILRGVEQRPDERYALRVSRIGVFDDVVDGTFENAMACRLTAGLPMFEARVTGTNPG
jgi:peptidoglycan/xylan/chitin deacetylase (PgdA/CDA1 family)